MASDDLLNFISSAEIIPGYRTDHSAITLKLNFSAHSRGKGYWKFNNSLLHDKESVQLIKDNIEEIKQHYAASPYDRNCVSNCLANELQLQIEDDLFFEMVLLHLRGNLISHCSYKKKKKIEKEMNLEKEIEALEKEKVEKPFDRNIYEQLEKKNKELEEERKSKVDGLIIRSRARWYEQGERNTNYFCNLENRNYMNKTIQELVLNQNESVKDQKTILEEVAKFYKNLYSESLNDELIDNPGEFLIGCDYEVLSDEEKSCLEGEITYEELANVVKKAKNNSSPGGSGYTNEFYKFFWKDLGQFLLRSLNCSYKKGQLTITQRRGIITCLPKPGKVRNLIKNWRPISLLNASYKFASSCIANRIKAVLNKLIHDDQKGFLPGRFIGENTRLIYDIVYETKRLEIPGMILLIDFEKAFDTVSWSFIDKVLDIFNFGNSIKQWIHTFYKNSQSCVIQNGFLSSFFNLGRGCRQGDPLSPYLFLLCAEVLGILIRNNKTLKGIKIFEKEFRISQYADDTSQFLDGSEKSLREALRLLKLFYNMSGLKINVEKTKIIWIGAMAGSQIQMCRDFKLDWEQGNFTVLGIVLNNTLHNIVEINYNEKVNGIKKMLASWSKRHLTIFGKISVLKTLIIPKLNHLFSSIPNPDQAFVKQLERIFFKFIWNKSNDKIKRKVVTLSYERGGFNMTDLTDFINSLKVSWIRRLFYSGSSWTIFIKDYLNKLQVDVFSVGPKVCENLIKDCNPFWSDVFRAWEKYVQNSLNSFNEKEILLQPIWFNHLIKFKLRKNWYEQGIRTISDLVTNQGNFHSFVTLQQTFGIRGTFLDFKALIDSLPKEWVRKIKDKILPKPEQPQQPKWISVLLKQKKGCGHIYKILRNNNNDVSIQVSCIQKWNREFDMALDDRMWKEIFLIPYRATVETKLREFQLKIIHRIIPTRKFLHKIKFVDDDKCCFCQTNIEDISHLFFGCENVKILWEDLKGWLISLSFTNMIWTAKDILLGVVGENPIINHIIIITKYFIYRASIVKSELLFTNLINCIYSYYKVEKLISKRQNSMNKFLDKWSSFTEVFENPL